MEMVIMLIVMIADDPHPGPDEDADADYYENICAPIIQLLLMLSLSDNDDVDDVSGHNTEAI